MATNEKTQGKQPASELPKFSIFHFPPELLTNLHLHSKLNRISKNTAQDKGKQSESKAHISTPHSIDQETELSQAFASARLAKPTCHTCGGIEFGSAQQQRAHFKTPWHHQNVQRKMEWRRTHTDARDESGYPWRPIKEETSDSEESLAEDTPVEQQNQQSDSDDEEDEGRGQYLWFADSEHEESIRAYGVHRRILLPKRMHGAHVDAVQVSCELQKMQLPPAPAKTHAELKADKQQRKAELSTQALPQVDPDSSLWTLMASNGGFFAAAVFDNRTGTVIAHKAIQRYTTRRKQGGLQSKQDGASGRAAISAGAQIRRYNERRLQEEIYELMAHWQPLLARSARVFVRVPRTSRRSFFKPDAALSWGDEHVRTLPVSMGRPNLRELQRVYMTLTRVRLAEFNLSVISTNTSDDVIEPVSIQEPELSSMSDNTLEPEPRPDLIEFVYTVAQMLMDQQQADEAIVSHLSEHLDKLLDAFSDPAMKLRYLEDCPHVQGYRTPTLLHLASHLGRRSLVEFLLDVGEDPTIINGHAPLYAGGMTAFQVARDRATRDTFRIYRFEHEGEPDGIDWERARVPDPLSPQQQQENEQRVREKKRRERERRKQQNQKQKKNNQAKPSSKDEDEMLDQAIKENQKQAKQSLRSQVTQMSPKEIQERMRKMAASAWDHSEVRVEKQLTPEEQRARDRELRFQAAERRRKQQQTQPQQQGTSSTEKCTHCGRSLHGLVPFEQFDWKCCSIECLHGQQMVFGIDL